MGGARAEETVGSVGAAVEAQGLSQSRSLSDDAQRRAERRVLLDPAVPKANWTATRLAGEGDQKAQGGDLAVLG